MKEKMIKGKELKIAFTESCFSSAPSLKP